ncbi:MAG: serine/threonine protein kinase, partial [Candidatus Riflebacteria bacterium]|nr:serine/threonine protein kinase [Candidatus Riflebacteria bacterium]
MSIDLLQNEIGGRYRDLSPMAQGGMGLLLSAVQVESGRKVAIKVLSCSLAGEPPPELKARFLREARAIGRLSHPFIVRVLEIGDHGQIPFFVMELVDGETLGAFIARQKTADIPRHLRIVLDMCDALKHAHQKQVIHRDLKPDNVVLLEQGGLKVLDFGLAKVDEQTNLTATGTIMGTPAYMAPEQLEAELTDHRADIYSLGIITYELVTLKVPFPGDSFYLKTKRPPATPSSVNGDVSPALDAAILRSLAISPEDRFQSVQEFELELSRCLKEYVQFSDLAVMAQDWKALLQTDLERLASEGAPGAGPIVLKEGMVRDVVLLVVRLLGATSTPSRLQREGVSFVRDRTLCLLTQEVERFGGTLDRYEPDGLVAFFGS